MIHMTSVLSSELDPRTAEFVGMERSALHRKLKSLGVFGNDRPLKIGA